MGEPSDLVRQTIAYYNDHAQEFCQRSVHVDMGPVYGRFVPHLPRGGRVLDAGCGSGRDTKAFMAMGFDVLAIDASREMVAATSALTGRPALLLPFGELDYHDEFDGIWACGSLLHVPRLQLAGVLRRLTEALRRGSVIYVSLKYGTGEHVRESRLFTDMDEESFRTLLGDLPELELIEEWTSEDVRGTALRRWFNAVCRKACVTCSAGGSYRRN